MWTPEDAEDEVKEEDNCFLVFGLCLYLLGQARQEHKRPALSLRKDFTTLEKKNKILLNESK